MIGQGGQILKSGPGRQHGYPSRTRNEHLAQPPLAAQHVGKTECGRKSKQHVQVAEAQVGVQHHHAPPEMRKRHRQIRGDVGLADPAFPARDRHDADDAAGSFRYHGLP